MVAKRELRWSLKNEELIKKNGMNPRRTVVFAKLPQAVKTSAQLTKVIEYALHGRADTQGDRTPKAGRTAANKANKEADVAPGQWPIVVAKIVVEQNGAGLVEFAAEEDPQPAPQLLAAGSGLARWGAPLVDMPRGAKLLAALAEGKMYEVNLPNPFPAVVGGAESPEYLNMGRCENQALSRHVRTRARARHTALSSSSSCSVPIRLELLISLPEWPFGTPRTVRMLDKNVSRGLDREAPIER